MQSSHFKLAVKNYDIVLNLTETTKETAIKLFEEKQVRSAWNQEEQKWYISIVDVIAVLTNSANPNNY